MESANFHLHHQEEHHLVDSSFSWSQNPILNGTNNIISSRNFDTGMGYPIENFVSHELQCLERIKDEFSVAESYPKFLELLNCSPTSNTEDLNLHPYSSYLKNNDHQQISYSNGTLSQIFPTINIPRLNQCTTTSSSSSTISSSSFDMNCLPALNLFGSPRFDGNFNYHASLTTHNRGATSYGFDRTHQPIRRPSVCPSKITSVSTTRRTAQSSKRPASKYVDAKESTQSVPPKKSKLEPRSSSAPFQIRKEKLGDKIAAIQQLVAPFGKTDTASVLMEAIGYIKFLQTQVETLSVPYMKSTNKIIGGISSERGQIEDGNTEAKRALQSRGFSSPLTQPVFGIIVVTPNISGN
ncbi:hypothetical protein L1987_47256 [Smallanthus sonchifolius]|uniref:Uncharacterized protein n=1 Tax=Smallanthus sonchifolius TaxID=185202 RepID=A0ACB9G2K6_9ASTR|nr:hypothetical protein L1987_47256 [Smallanthus sonchifolius]